jgi:hypothetical protein
MLFDLQSGKRRRVVQVVFGFLAVIFAVSFVFFGVGSEAGFNPFADGGGGDADDPFKDDIENAQEALATNPRDTAALSELVELHFQSGGRLIEPTATGFNLPTDAEEEFIRAADAWDQLVKVTKGQNVDSGTALIAVQTFATMGQGLITKASEQTGQAALDDADDALAAFRNAGEAQLLVAKEPDARQLVQAADYFYLGGDTKAGDAAAQRAVAAAEGKEKQQVQKAVDSSKRRGEQLNKQIEDFRKSLEKATPGAEGGGLGDLGGDLGTGGGGLGGSGLTTP